LPVCAFMYISQDNLSASALWHKLWLEKEPRFTYRTIPVLVSFKNEPQITAKLQNLHEKHVAWNAARRISKTSRIEMGLISSKQAWILSVEAL